MLVRMRTHISGTRNGREWPTAGSVIELPDDEAADYCRRGDAEPVTTFRDAETTTLNPPAETRTPPPPARNSPLTTRSGPRGRTTR